MMSKYDIAWQVMISEEEIQRRTRELAQAVDRDYLGQDIVLVCNLKGAFVFLADFCRELTTLHEVDFIATSSYKGTTASSGVVRIVKDLKADIDGRHVLIVEDIIDSGLTLDYVCRYLRLHNPASIRIVTLLDKKEARKVEIEADYVGFEIPDKFVLGYGLDFFEHYRNLKFIAEYKGPE